MNNEPIYIIINIDGVRINIRLQSGATLLPLDPKMTGSWRLAECTSPIVTVDMITIAMTPFLNAAAATCNFIMYGYI